MNDLTFVDEDGDELRVRQAHHSPVAFRALDTEDGERAAVVLEYEDVHQLHAWLAAWLVAHGPTDARPDAEADGYSWGASTEADYGLRSALRAPTGATESSVATEAHDAVYGDRHTDYGHPREDFTRTAILWTGLLQHKLAEGEFITAEDMARCMIAVKLSRDVHAPKRDNRVDMAGYAITLDRLESGK